MLSAAYKEQLETLHAVLPDGRNAHLIQKGKDWWLEKLANHFETINFSENGNRDLVALCEVGHGY